MITEATIQEVLRENNVTIEQELPEEDSSGLLVIGKLVEFDVEQFPVIDDQEIELLDEYTAFSTIEEPFSLSQEQTRSEIEQFLTLYVFQGDQYRYAGYDQEKKQMHFYQAYGEKIAYTFDDQPLVLHLNEDQEIISYQQRLFHFEEQEGEDREILSSLKAIEILLNDQLIRMNQTITNVQFGYYSFFSPTGDVQVFAPMWRVTVDGEVYLVHATGGTVQQLT